MVKKDGVFEAKGRRNIVKYVVMSNVVLMKGMGVHPSGFWRRSLALSWLSL